MTADPANLTTTGQAKRESIVASARPEPPKVVYIMPTFEWVVSDDGNSRTRVGRGLRVYLDRPWYSSGDDELLGVLLAPSLPANPDAAKYISEWGADPVWTVTTSLAPLGLADFENALANAPPDFTQAISNGPFPLAANGTFEAQVAPFAVEYNDARKLWFRDIEFASTKAYTPFVRLALVRYQPYAVTGDDDASDMHVSRVVRTEFMQVLPDRGVTIFVQRQ